MKYLSAVGRLISTSLCLKHWEKIQNSKIVFKLLRSILLAFQPFTKKDTFILFDNLYEKNAECIDTYCLFKFMQERYIRSYYVLWKKNVAYEQLKSEGSRNVVVVKNTIHDEHNFEFFAKIWKHLFRAKAVITSFGDLNSTTTRFLYTNKHITYIHIGHGPILLKTFVLTTPYFSHSNYNKFLTCSNQEAAIFQRYGWKREDLPIIGLPRWDNLRREPQQKKTIFTMFTWRISFGAWNKNIFTTPLEKTMYSRNIKLFLADEKLQELLATYRITMQVALHHALLDQTNRRYKFNCKNVEIVPCERISRYIGKADLFVTDYSSIFFDFAFLNTPIVFYRPDFDDGELLELDKEDMINAQSKDNLLYNIYYDKDGAIRCIEKYIENNFILEEENRRKNNVLFSTKKNIKQKFISYLEDL